MSRALESPGATTLAMWRRFRGLPLGQTMFGWLLGWMVPYSATIAPRVHHLEPGHARVAIADRRGVRNHLNSVHALALANLGELTSGLAMTTTMPGTVRGIVLEVSTEYVKKARGTITAESRAGVPEVRGDVEHVVEATMRDASGDVVATTRVRWKLGPREA